jgi:hypothetical protein
MVQLPPSASEEPQVLFSEKSAGSAPVNVMLVMFKVALPVLSRVTDSVEQAASTGQFPNAWLDGERLTLVPVLVPVPERLTLWGLPMALSVKETAAVRDPLAAGVKVTLIVQLPPAATLAPQVLVWTKSPGLAPERAMLEIVKAAEPVLFSVTAWAVLVVPTDWLAKVRLLGERLTTGETALMVSVRVALPVPALLVALNVTVELPDAVGVPEINPVVLLSVKPAGNPVAP